MQARDLERDGSRQEDGTESGKSADVLTCAPLFFQQLRLAGGKDRQAACLPVRCVGGNLVESGGASAATTPDLCPASMCSVCDYHWWACGMPGGEREPREARQHCATAGSGPNWEPALGMHMSLCWSISKLACN